MPTGNEFVARKGLISNGDVYVTGSIYSDSNIYTLGSITSSNISASGFITGGSARLGSTAISNPNATVATLEVTGPANISGTFAVLPSSGNNTASVFTVYGDNSPRVQRFNVTRAGNVGIGTTNPANKLEVVGNISCSVITASNFFGTSSFATNALTASNVSGGTNTYLARWTGNTSLSTGLIRDNGTDLGIGSAPASVYGIYHIRTSIETASETAGYNLTITNPNTGSTVLQTFRATSLYNAPATSSISGICSDFLSYTQVNSSGSTYAQIKQFYAGGFILTGSVTDKTSFYAATAAIGTGATVTTEHGVYVAALSAGTTIYGIRSIVAASATRWNLYIDGTAKNYIAGDVGIGTSSPSAKLTVRGTGTGYVNIGQFTDTSYGAISLGGALTAAEYNFAAGHSGSSDQNDLYISRKSGGDVHIKEASGTDQLIIKTGGNVGIGTTAPGVKLDVFGTARILTQGVPATGAGMEFSYVGGGSPYGTIYSYNRDTSAYIDTILGAGGNQLFLKASGNVGVGTSIPNTLLNVGSGTPSTAANGIQFGSDTSANLYRSAASTIKTDGSLTVGSQLSASQLLLTTTATGVGYLGSSDTTYGPLLDIYSTAGNNRDVGIRLFSGSISTAYLGYTVGYNGQNQSFVIGRGVFVPSEVHAGIVISGNVTNQKVGINMPTTNSVATNTLDVYGNISASSFTGSHFGTSSYAQTASVAISASYAPGGSGLTGGTTNYIPVWTGANSLSSSVMYQSGAYVGVGLTNPMNRLDVAGNISCSVITASLFFGTSSFATTATTANALNTGNNYTIAGLTVQSGSLSTVSGSSITIASFNVNNGSGGKLSIIETRFATGSDWTTASTRIQKITDVTNQAYIDFNPSGSNYGIAFGTGVAVEKMRIDSSGNVGIGTTNPSYKLQVVGSFSATTKSFDIEHPTKSGKRLVYGSLESPYHGVRLTGKGKLIKGKGVIQLPDYINSLVDFDNANVQITNIKHNKAIYVDNIDEKNNIINVVAKIPKTQLNIELEFYWTFTAVRKDVPNLQVEL